MPKPRVVASIEARMGSSRLPGKVLMDICGKPALHRLVERLRACQSLDEIVVATSSHSTDDVLADWCDQHQVKCFRGSEEDVLNRAVKARQWMDTDVIVEITGDCPLTDPDVVDLGVETFLSHDADVVSNCGMKLTWQMGQYVQVFSYSALEEVDRTVSDSAVHEHVSLHFYENPDQYSIINLMAPRRWRHPKWRFQLDYKEDLQFQNEIYRRLEPQYGSCFGTEEVVALLQREHQLIEINRHCEGKPVR